MSQLPILSPTQITVPTYTRDMSQPRAKTAMSRTRGMNATVPRPNRPAPLYSSVDFTALPSRQLTTLEARADDVMRGVTSRNIEPEQLPGVIIVLKERKRQASLKGNYDESQHIQDKISNLNNILLARKHDQIHSSKLMDIDMQIAQAKSDLKSMTDRWNNRVAQFNKNQKDAAIQLEASQQSRLRNFDSSIPSDLPPNFCKLSAQLLDMREQERQLVLSKRYDEASSLQKECDRREKIEVEQQKLRFLRLKEKERRKMIEDQAIAVNCFTSKWTRQSETLTKQMESEIAKQKKFLENLIMRRTNGQNGRFVA